jgi:hypothetical protein
MKEKIRLIKKDDRNLPAAPVEAEVSPDPKEWSVTVNSWVSEFQKDRREESLEAFETLFGDSKP